MFKKNPCVIFFNTQTDVGLITKTKSNKTVLPAYYFGGKRSSAIDMGRVGEG